MPRKLVMTAVAAAMALGAWGGALGARADEAPSEPAPAELLLDPDRPVAEPEVDEAEVLEGVVEEASPRLRAAAAAPVFDHTLIMTDYEFYRSGALAEAEIKDFVTARGANCKAGAGQTCLKDLVVPATSLTSDRGDAGCGPVTLPAGTRAWTAIDKVAKACSISPKVLLTTIQKESSGVVQPKTGAQWDKMMGMGCPDGGTCAARYAGFANQLYFGADRLRAYRTWTTYPFIKAYLTGTPAKPLDEGVAAFVPRSMATASLYTYTPWVSSNRLFFTVMKGFFPEALALGEPTAVGSRWGGSSRYETALLISRNTWTAAATKYVYLARGDVTADAQVAGSLTGGPILLTAPGEKNAAVLAEIKRLGNPPVVVIGSAGTLSDDLVRYYSGGKAFTRLGGPNREATAVEVSKRAFPSGSAPKAAYLTDGYGSDPAVGSPDGVVGGALTDGPILLVRPGSAPTDATRNELARLAKLGATKVYSLGNHEVGVPLAGRLAGPNRYVTALKIAQRAFPSSATTVYLADGAVFVDAVAAGAVTDGPILLVQGDAVDPDSCAYLAAARPSRVVALGSSASVSTAALDSAVRCTVR